MPRPVAQCIAGGVLTLVLDQPERRNVLDAHSYAAIADGLRRAEQDSDIRTVVLTARGRFFSAGVDLRNLQEIVAGDLEGSVTNARLMAGVLAALSECTKPTVAAVQGSAYGGGVALVLACDLVVASEAASFSVGELRLGLFPGLVAPLLAEAVGRREARRWLLTSETIGAEMAAQIGIVHELVPAEQLQHAVARQVAQLRLCGPDAVAATKRLLRDPRAVAPSGPDWDDLAEISAGHRLAAEAREGVAAFLEKRRPSWVAGKG